MRSGKRNCRGNTIVEFTLVGIPLIFVLISIAEISRAMWAYTTVAHAVREGTRFAIVHGHNCEVAPNTCAGYATIGWIARRIRQGGVGLVPDDLSLTFTSANSSFTYTLADCLSAADGGTGAHSDQPWPVFPDNNMGMPVAISARYPFRTFLGMLWPGSRPTVFSDFNLPAVSQDVIQF